MGKLYKSAPLPFMGQKKGFVGEYERVIDGLPEGMTIVDLFGGSGLLSHVAKRRRPDCRVVYNDFDNYSWRLSVIDDTNRLLGKIFEVVSGVPKKQLISGRMREEVLRLIEMEERDGVCGLCYY